MKAVLYFKDNGFGLTQDAIVIKDILEALDFTVVCKDPNDPVYSDISIHFEIPATKGLRLSLHSVFFPNFEWFFWDTSILREYDVLACKTRHALPIARRFSDNVIYTGFTSEDMLSIHRVRNFNFVHIAGQSRLKNTLQVLQCWINNPNLPTLHIYTHAYPPPNDLPSNVDYHFGPVERSEIQRALNENLVAVLPSATEGFGQVLWEALSTGSILITTDAEPMVEVPAQFYVPAFEVDRHNMQVVWKTKPDDIAESVRKSMELTNAEIAVQSINSRQAWIENHNAFVRRFLNIL